jgi:hypothetical protein
MIYLFIQVAMRGVVAKIRFNIHGSMLFFILYTFKEF